jgi:UDP-N-acetylmuramate dehydrogenase
VSSNGARFLDFCKYTSIHIGGVHEVLVINEMGDYSEFQIIGRGNNLLIDPQTKTKFAILGEAFDYIEQKEDKLYVGCATKSGKLLSYAKKHNLANFEFLGKLPGNLGGLVKMNAGLKQWEIFNYIDSIKTKEGYIKKENIKHGYRYTHIDTIVYEVVFNLSSGYSKEMSEQFSKMRENQPQTPSAGSCFKNPQNESAGRLIEQVGLKGFCKNGMAFSSQHANFLVNYGGGTYEDAMFLIELAKQKVKEAFDIELELEIEVF